MQNSPLISSNYLTTRQAARLLDISHSTAQQWVDRGILKSWKTEGGHRRILQSSVDQVLEAKRVDADQAHAPYVMPVLIVEDEIRLIHLYQDHMRQWSFGVRTYVASNGYEGLILAGEVQPKMVISDLRLPGVNGFNIVRGMCQMERFNGTRMVVVSGLPLEEIKAHGDLPERVTVMGKPVAYDQLKAIAEDAWNMASKLQA
jgi:excisionase family DNA binding protein